MCLSLLYFPYKIYRDCSGLDLDLDLDWISRLKASRLLLSMLKARKWISQEHWGLATRFTLLLPSRPWYSGPASLRNSYTICLRVYPRPPPQKIHVPWTAAGLLSYKALFLPRWEGPTKFREGLQRLFDWIYNLLFTEEKMTKISSVSSHKWSVEGQYSGVIEANLHCISRKKGFC